MAPCKDGVGHMDNLSSWVKELDSSYNPIRMTQVHVDRRNHTCVLVRCLQKLSSYGPCMGVPPGNYRGVSLRNGMAFQENRDEEYSEIWGFRKWKTPT